MMGLVGLQGRPGPKVSQKRLSVVSILFLLFILKVFNC